MARSRVTLPPDDDLPVPRRRFAPRKRSWLAILLLLLLIAVVLGPTLIAKSSLINSTLAKAIPPTAGKVSVGSASLSWLSPPQLSNLQVTDAAGQPLLSAESVEVQSSLWSLLWNRNQIGPIRVVRPQATIVVKPGGTNLEAFLRALEPSPAPPADPTVSRDAERSALPADLNFELVDGTVNLIEPATNERWRANNLNALVAKRGEDLDALGLAASGKLQRLGPNGSPAAAGDFRLDLPPAAQGRRAATLQAAGLPLAVANMWLRRAGTPVEVDGLLSAKGSAWWNAAKVLEALPTANGPTMVEQLLMRGIESSGVASIANLQVRSEATGADPVRRAGVQLPWKLHAAGNRLVIDTLEITSEVAQVKATGAATAPELNALAGGDPLALGGVQLEGKLNLAQLAALAPTVIQLRPDTKINSGVARFKVTNNAVEGGRQVAVALKTSPLRAITGGQPIEWDVPLAIDATASKRGGVWGVEGLSCVSEFLQAQGAGDPNNLSVTAKLDLNKLATQLGKFIDLGEWRLAGQGSAKVLWKTPAPGRFDLSTVGELTNVLVGYRDAPLAAEEKLNFTTAAVGVVDPVTGRPGLIETGSLGVTAGADQLTAKLTEPMAFAKRNATWPVDLSLVGDLNSWRRRIALTPAGASLPRDLAAAGQLQLSANGRVSPNRGELSISQFLVTGLAIDTAGWRIRERQFQAGGQWRWDLKKGIIESPQGQLVSETVSLRSRNIAISLADASAGSTGEVALRADLARLAACQVSNPPARYQPQGVIVGGVKLSKQAGAIVGNLDLVAKPIALFDLATPAATGPPQPVWQEPELKINGAVVYDQPTDRLELRDLVTESNTIRSKIGGEILALKSRGETRLAGTVDYDLERLTPLLWPYVGGPNVKFVGRDQAKFTLEGSLHSPPNAAPLHWSRTLRGRMEAPWTQANVFGLPLGPGKVAARLGEGALDFEPLEFTAGGGQIAAKPVVKLDPPPQLLTHPPGTIVSQVVISQEVTQQVLKFIAPVLADATRIDGRFSLSLSELTAPLENARAGRATGKLMVHSVTVQPGPMVAEWTTLARQIEGLVKAGNPEATLNRGPPTLMSIRDQAVDFKLENGRVFHRGLQFDIGNVAVTSSGSVGLDESLDLLLSIPINPEWLANRPVLAGAFAGKTIQIPVRGTFARPQLNRDVFQQLSRDFVEGALQGGLNGLLDRIRGGK